MKAVRLRVATGMLALVAFCVASVLSSGAALADEGTLESALEAYELGQYEDALQKLQEYVAGNPGNDEIYAILRAADENVLLKALAQGGEHQRLMAYLLKKAQPEATRELNNDAEIAALAKQAVEASALDERRDARVQLRAAGALAVPHLYEYLGSDEASEVVNAILALRQLGGSATTALAEVLGSSNAQMRGYAAAVLGDIGDPRAVPALTAATADDDPGVKEKAHKALGKIGGPEGSAAEQYVRLGNRYYSKDVTLVAAFDETKNMWGWADDGLARYEVPSYLYGYQMAEECAFDALALEPGNADASALLVRALLAQKVEGAIVTASGGEAPEALDGAFDLAESQGFAAASNALAACLGDRDWDVAVECCDLVAATYGGEDLSGSPLGDALVAPMKRVRYSAAISALKMSPKRLPNADQVASLAAQAASESAIRQVLVIDDVDESRSKLLMALANGGYVAAGESSGTEGVMRAKSAPTLDVILVRADLGDQSNTTPDERHTSSLMVIDELSTDARTRDMRIVVLVGETAESQVEAVQEFFTQRYGEKVNGYVRSPVVEGDAMGAINTAAEAGDLNADRQRANEMAARAAGAFAEMDFTCATFDLGVAVDPLATAATDGPTPEIRMNAVRALGNIRVGGAEALLAVLTEGEGEDLQAAAATALGAVLSAIDGTPEQADALIAAAAGEGAVAKAALTALGQVRSLTPEQRLKIFTDHRLPIATPGE